MSTKQEALAKIDGANEALSSSIVGKALLDGGLSLIPGVGAALVSALDSRAFKLYEENSRRLVEELRSEYEQIQEDKLDREFIESDEFVSILLETVVRNSRTHEKEKTRLFARAFASFSSQDYSSIPHKEGFLEIIERLSFDHARAMALIHKCSLEPLAENQNTKVVTAVLLAGKLRRKQSHVEAWCEQLARYGLIKDARLGTYQYEPGQYEITIYGREFAEFLGDLDL